MENLALEAIFTIILNISIISIVFCLIYQAFNKVCQPSKPLKAKEKVGTVSRDLSELATAHAWGQSIAEDRKEYNECNKHSGYVAKILATKQR